MALPANCGGDGGRPRVAFDLRWIGRDSGGITTNSLNVLKTLVEQESEFDFLALLNPGQDQLISRYLGTPIRGVALVFTSCGLFWPSSQIMLPKLLRRRSVDIFHSPIYLGLVRHPGLHVVITVHDLTIFCHPESLPRAKSVRLYPGFALAFGLSIKSASRIIVPSKTTLNHLGRVFPGAVSRAEVIYPAVNPLFFERCDADRLAMVRNRHRTAKHTILYVGRREPYRNLVRLIQALALLRRRGLEVHLIIAGPNDCNYPEPERAVRALRLESCVESLGFVELPMLQALYQAVDALVFPSSYEGFGLPLIEAMASKTPVVCSRCSALPETVGEAAILVDPARPEDIADGIGKVLSDPAVRERLVRCGLERARLFSCDAEAGRLLALYRRLST
jgi:glycosyltransferase involved in cell wall biosynthesis